MCTNQNIGFSFFKFFKRNVLLLGAFKTVNIINPAREVFQSFGKSFEMLNCQHRCRNKNSNLFAVSHSFKGGPNGNFCFSKAHIAADKPIHG